MEKLKTHTFNGVQFDVDLAGPVDGLVDNPKGGRPSMVICADLDTRRGLEACVHESLHACHFLKSEESVERTARDIARFLWRLGYRFCGEVEDSHI